MKTWMVLMAVLMLGISLYGCGSEGDRTQWTCVCTGARTTFVCSDFSDDAEAQATVDVCDGEEGCGCACVDTHINIGC